MAGGLIDRAGRQNSSRATAPAKPFRIPEITYPLVIDTIGKELAMGGEITVSCVNYLCHNTARLNLVSIARRKGMDYPNSHDALLRVVYCPRCRAAGKPDRKLQFTTTPQTSASDWPRAEGTARPRGESMGKRDE